jgi:hypothetical protein
MIRGPPAAGLWPGPALRRPGRRARRPATRPRRINLLLVPLSSASESPRHAGDGPSHGPVASLTAPGGPGPAAAPLTQPSLSRRQAATPGGISETPAVYLNHDDMTEIHISVIQYFILHYIATSKDLKHLAGVCLSRTFGNYTVVSVVRIHKLYSRLSCENT